MLNLRASSRDVVLPLQRFVPKIDSSSRAAKSW